MRPTIPCGKFCGRIVRQTKGTQHFIETCDKHWVERLDTWRKAYAVNPKTTIPGPMPYGHFMFKFPEDYKMERIAPQPYQRR